MTVFEGEHTGLNDMVNAPPNFTALRPAIRKFVDVLEDIVASIWVGTRGPGGAVS